MATARSIDWIRYRAPGGPCVVVAIAPSPLSRIAKCRLVIDVTSLVYHRFLRFHKGKGRHANRCLAVQDGAARGLGLRALGRIGGTRRRDEGAALSYEDILYEVGGGRATITINRPERLNAFRVQTIRELCEAFEAAADDEAVGVIVFTGAGE